MNNDNTHICWPPVFLSPTSLHHATKKQRQQAQINTAKSLVVVCFPQIRERFQTKICESKLNILTLLNCNRHEQS